MKKLRLGISACLAGERTRYDGRDAKDALILEALGGIFYFIPVCPEAESGLPVPRERMRLEGSPSGPRLITINTRLDRTAMVKRWADEKIISLKKEPVCGFVFKSRSPSCGLRGVDVFDADGNIIGTGSGIFASEFLKSFPLVPAIDGESVHDPETRADFISRASAYSKLLRL